ncbi:MAG: hypothetical protein MUC48_25770 [Leptolyngbya sp. Prado105]|jgi:hypothetical protein|nr:hypothetical protein [Leptolyngbya sp. Prado105]
MQTALSDEFKMNLGTLGLTLVQHIEALLEFDRNLKANLDRLSLNQARNRPV